MIKINLDPEPGILRQFAWISLFAFPLAGLAIRWQFGLPWTGVMILAGLGLLVFTAGVLLGDRIFTRAVFTVLVVVATPIGFLVSWVLVGLIYFGLFTAIGLIFRLMGRDALRRRLEPEASSYWIDRGPERPVASYFKLY